MINPFAGNGFSLITMTNVVNELKFLPGRIGELGLFEPQAVTTTEIAVERKGDTLMLVPPTPRGGVGVTQDRVRRELRSLTVPHFEIADSVAADEVQGVRAFGSEAATDTVMAKVAERMQNAVRNFALTEEHARMGAIKGVVTYADGSSLDLFAEFGVTPEAEIDFDLDNASAVDGALRRKCTALIRKVADQLGGVNMKRLHAFCGDNYFDDLLGNPEVRETFKGWSEAKILREGYVGADRSSWGSFDFGGIVWENYRGATGIAGFVDPDKCSIFPVGVPGLFRTAYAPADYLETVNTPGQRLYTKATPWPNDKGVALEIQMNALQYCTRPRTLIQGRRT